MKIFKNVQQWKFCVFLVFFGLFLHIFSLSAQGATPVLVKTEASPTVFLIVNNQRYPLRNEAIFFDYGFSWNQVQTISSAKLQTYPLTRLVKTRNDPRVYFLDHALGTKHWQATERIFLRYGNRFSDVIEVSTFDLSSWEDQKLVKSASSPYIYFLEGNTRRLIPTEHDFLMLEFQWKDVATVADFDLEFYHNASPLVAKDTLKQENRDQASRNILHVSSEPFDADAPRSFPAYSRNNLYLRLSLATQHDPVSIASIEFRQVGHVLGERSSLILVDPKQGTRIGQESSLGSERVRVPLTRGELVIPPFTKKTLHLLVNLGGLDRTISGHSLVLTDIQSTGTVEQEVVRSPLYHLVFDADFTTRVGVDVINLFPEGSELRLSRSGQDLARFRLRVMEGNEDVLLTQITMTALGNVSFSHLSNLTLSGTASTTAAKRKTGKKGKTSSSSSVTQAAVVRGKELIFDFSDRPLTIPLGREVWLTLRGDIAGAAADQFLNFVIEHPSDLVLQGKDHGQLIVAVPFGINDTSFPIGDRVEAPFNFIQIRQGQLQLTLSKQSPKENLIPGKKQSLLALFEIKNERVDAFLERLEIQIQNPSERPLTGNIMVKNGNTILVSASAALFQNHFESIRFQNPVLIRQNGVIRISIEGEVPFDAPASDTYQVSVRNLVFQSVPDSSSFALIETAEGHILKVTPFLVSLRANDALLGREIPAGKAGQTVASFFVKNASGETIKIHKIRLHDAQGNLNAANGLVSMQIRGQKDILVFGSESLPYTFDVDMILSASREARVDVVLQTTDAASGAVMLALDFLRIETLGSEQILTFPGNDLLIGNVTLLPKHQ